MHDWKDSSRGVLAGAVTGVVFGVGGFFATEIPGTHAMGLVVFVLVPLAAGFAITMVSHGLQRVSAAAMLATLVSLAILIATGLETVLCALIAFPLLLAGLLIGVALGYLFLKLKDKFGGDGGGSLLGMLALSPLSCASVVGFDAGGLTIRFRRKKFERKTGQPSAQSEYWGSIIRERTELQQADVEGLFREAQTEDATFAAGCGTIDEIRDVQIPRGTPVYSLDSSARPEGVKGLRRTGARSDSRPYSPPSVYHTIASPMRFQAP